MPSSNLRYYPASLAAELRERWPAPARASLPPPAQLEEFIAVAYQASLLAEEGRPVQCWLLLRATLPTAPTDPAHAPYQLELATPRPYNEQEIRRLSPALSTPGNVLAVRPDAADELVAWAILRSQGPVLAEEAPQLALPDPPALLLYVRGPGDLVFYAGPRRVLTLRYGRVEGHGFVDYPTAWSENRFLENVAALDEQLGPSVLATTPTLLPVIGGLAHQVVRRVVARVRASGHGGMLAFVPTASAPRYVGPAATLRPKYPVRLPATAPPYFQLELAVLQRLLALGTPTWAAFQASGDARLRELEEAINEYADLLASLMTVDGAVVITKQLTVIGFGIEVYAPQLYLPVVYRALDAAGHQLQAEPADGGGTRHRAAYRLCLAEPESMAVVVSQDGGVRFVHAQAGKVVFWDQLAV